MKFGNKKSLVTALAIAVSTAMLGSAGMAVADSTADAAGRSATQGVSIHASAKVLAAQIVSRWAPVAEAAGMDLAIWHEQYSMQLGLMSEQALLALNSATPDAAAGAASNYQRFVQAYRSALMTSYASGTLVKTAPKLGSAITDQTFVPIPPCRIVDTRNVGGPITFGNARNFFFYTAGGGFSWSTQGGVGGPSSTSCPATINPNGGVLSAAMVSISVVGPTAAGNWITWGGASPIPTAASLLWAAGQNLTAATVIPWGGRTGSGPGGTIKDFGVYYNGPSGAANFVADVVGYFVDNQATALECFSLDTVSTTTSVVNTAAFTILGAACTAGYTATSIACFRTGTAISGVNLIEIEKPEPGFTQCRWQNLSGGTINPAASLYTQSTRCCRVPGQ